MPHMFITEIEDSQLGITDHFNNFPEWTSVVLRPGVPSVM